LLAGVLVSIAKHRKHEKIAHEVSIAVTLPSFRFVIADLEFDV